MSQWLYLLLPFAFVGITAGIAWCIESFLATLSQEPTDEE